MCYSRVIYDTQISKLLTQWLSLGNSIFDAILNIITSLCGRSCKTDEQLVMLAPIMQELPSFLAYMNSILSLGYSDENYLKLKNLGQFFHDLGVRQLTYRKSGLLDAAKFSCFLDCVLTLTEHESEVLGSLMLDVWAALIKHEVVTKNPSFIDVLPRLVNVVTGKLLGLYQKTLNFNSQKFNQSDFDDVKEFEHFLSLTRSKLWELVRSVTKLNHSAMLELTLRGTEALLSMPYNAATVGKNPIGCTSASQYYKAVESSVVFFQGVLTGIGHKTPLDAANKKLLDTFIGTLITFPHNDPLCMTKLLEPIVEASLILQDDGHATHLSEVIQKVMSLVSFSPGAIPIEQLGPVQRDIITNLRRKSSNCLVRLGETFSLSFLPYFADIFQQIRLLLEESSMIGLPERTNLMEFLMVVVSSSKDENERLGCLEFVCKPIVDAFKEPEIVSTLESKENFNRYIGADILANYDVNSVSPTQLDQTLDTYQRRLQRLSYLVNTSLMIVRRLPEASGVSSQRPSSPIPMLDSSCLYFVRFSAPIMQRILWMIDSLYVPDGTSSTTSTSPLLELSLEEKKNLLGYAGFSKDIESSSSPASKKLIVSLKIFLFNARVSCYQYIGSVASVPSYYPLLGQYWSTLFSVAFTPHFPVRFWKHLIQLAVEPLILKCPAELYNEFLLPWLPEFMNTVTSIFAKMWMNFSASANASALNKSDKPLSADHEDLDGSLLDELLEEKLLRSSTHSFSSLILDLFFPVSERVSKMSHAAVDLQSPLTNQVHTMPPLLLYMINDQPLLLQAFLTNILQFFKWKDSFTCEKALSVCQRLLLHLAGRPEYSSYFGNALLMTLLNDVLADGYHSELHDAVLSFIALILNCTQRDTIALFSSIPVLVSADVNNITDFFRSFEAECDAKKRKLLTKQFLKPILGVKKSSLFKLDDDRIGIKSLPSKLIIHQIKSNFKNGSPSCGLSEFLS